jgi:nucleoside-diphosphate-sugar epimerase
VSRVLVTGATSFLGVSLIRYLVAGGHPVVALVRPSSPLERLAGTGAEVHIVEPGVSALGSALESVGPDCVVHLAGRYIRSHAPTDVGDLVDSNVRFGVELLEAMRRVGRPRIVTTGSFFQHAGGGPYEPVNLYAATKQAFESVLTYYVEVDRLQATTLVLTDIYGPGDWRQKLVNVAVRAARTGEPLLLSEQTQIMDLVHIDDAVRGLALAIADSGPSPGRSDRFALGSGHPTSVGAVLDLIEELVGRPLDRHWGAYPVMDRAVETIWDGPVLPGWKPLLDLRTGLETMVRSTP